MNIYFDTEFTGLVPNTTLISIGCVAETGEKFYAEFTDYDESLCSDWIKENVLDNLLLNHIDTPNYIWDDYDSAVDSMATYVKGTTDHVRKCFAKWLNEVSETRLQFVSDVCHYDFYLLCNQIFGGAFNLPENVNPVCYDICQEIKHCFNESISFADSMYNAFDISREDFLTETLCMDLPEGKKHNSLYDAEVIKMIYEGIHWINALNKC